MAEDFWASDPVHAPAKAAVPAAAGEDWWHADPVHETSVAGDVAKSAGSGLVKGVLSIGGLGGDLADLAKVGADKASQYLPDIPSPAPDSTLGRLVQFMKDESARSAKAGINQAGHGDLPGSYKPPTSAQLQGSLEDLTGPLHQPETTPGKYAQTVAEFVPAALATGGESVVPSLIKGAVLPGAGSEALGSRFEGTWMEPYARLLGALGGGVTGAVGAKGAEVAANRAAAGRAASDIGGDVTPSSVAKVAKNFENDRLTPESVAARQGELGDEAMMLDMGRQLQGRAEAIAAQPGKGQNKVLDAVENRTGNFGEGTANRTKDTLDQAMGPSLDIVAAQKRVNDVVDKVASPLYKQVMEAHDVVHVPESIAGRPAVADAMKRAVSLAKNYGEKLEGPTETKTILSGPGYHIAEDVAPQAQTSLRYWDYVKKSLDQRIRGIMQSGQDLTSAEKADLGGLQSARRALVEHLDDVTGGAYAVARKAAATKPEVKEAIELGRGSLSTKLLPEELAEEMRGMSLPQQAAVKAGMRREIDRIIDTARNDGAAARRHLDTNQNREKIAHVFGEDAAKEVDRRIAAETQFQDATNKVSANSRTAVRQQLMKDTEAASESATPSATLLGFAHAAARRGQQYLGDLSLERTKEGIADLLTRKGSDIPRLAGILSRYNAARTANAPPPISRQGGNLASILATQAPGWSNGYLPGPAQRQ